jgi:hypothetical protein
LLRGNSLSQHGADDGRERLVGDEYAIDRCARFVEVRLGLDIYTARSQRPHLERAVEVVHRRQPRQRRIDLRPQGRRLCCARV